ncbi:MAG: serine/threonine protein kinase [Gemmataceae bacterium]
MATQVIQSVYALVAALTEHQILEPVQQTELTRALQTRFTDARSLAKELIQRGWLTPYQINQLFQGKGADLVLGQYILLERLGEGGMGQVFKARHVHMGRVVALKVIRKEHLDQPDAVRRFRREIQAAAQLFHPNVVMAYDASQVDNTHFFVMEYVEGIDLATLLKRLGPPPVGLACEYIRQAALGLQHAFERGMVHRDIKPHNLLVTCPPETKTWPVQGAVVKILDMGLARVDLMDGPESVSALTKEGRVVGTPDYMAPEQAVNPHKTDIRADLYSMGCTFFQLLTNQVPFPKGTTMEKLLKHRLDPIPTVEKFRPEVPAGVSRIVSKLLAKKPEERYQTPGDLAAALQPWSGAGVFAPVAQIVSDTSETPLEAELATLSSSSLRHLASPAPPGESFWSWPVIIGGIVTMVIMLLFLIGIVLTMG